MIKLSEIEEYCKNAKKGPWATGASYNQKCLWWDDGKGGWKLFRKPDVAFINNSRTDLPEAIRLLREAREIITDQFNGGWDKDHQAGIDARARQFLMEVSE